MSSEQSEKHLLWLLDTARGMFKTRELSALLNILTRRFIDFFAAERVEIYLRERGSTSPRFRYGLARGSGGYRDSPQLQMMAGKAMLSRRPQSHQRADSVEGAWPLITETDIVGVLAFTGGDSNLNPETHQDVYKHFAALSAAALENARVFEQIQNDPLTGLPNSTHFLIQLNKALGAARENENVGILLLDLDDFKRVNTRAGAEMGDQALIDISLTLQEVLRADGLLARYGSDKFALLLPPDTDRGDLRLYDAAERARACVRTKVYHDISMSACIGGASFPNCEGSSAADLVAIADDALAKARGRGTGEVEIVWNA